MLTPVAPSPLPSSLSVTVMDDSDDRIYPPVLVITYAQRETVDIMAGANMAYVTFQVNYTKSLSRSVAVAVAVCVSVSVSVFVSVSVSVAVASVSLSLSVTVSVSVGVTWV